MLSNHLTNLVLFSIPEAIVIIMMTLILMGSKMDWKKHVISGVFVGTAAYVFRSAVGSVFINLILYAIYIIAALSFFKISGIFERFTCSAITMGIYITIEFVTLTIIISVLGLSEHTIASNVFLKFLFFLAQLLVVIGISYLLRFLRISVFK